MNCAEFSSGDRLVGASDDPAFSTDGFVVLIKSTPPSSNCQVGKVGEPASSSIRVQLSGFVEGLKVAIMGPIGVFAVDDW